MKKVTIRVPGTTANLGPGFDCLGIALGIHNDITVSISEPAGPKHPMVEKAAAAFFASTGVKPVPFHWEITGDVPTARGLGSSVTVRLGILHGLNQLTGSPLAPRRLYEICAALEGHPDNAAPGAFGGFVVSGPGSYERFEVDPALEFILLIPPFEVETPAARRVLPPQIERLSAVRSCGNACRITAAFATRRYESLRGAFADGLHQPFREPLVPFMPKVISAGEKAGALGGFLSGSGSAICCLTLANADEVAIAMQRACGDKDAYTLRTHADNRGVMALE